MYYYSDKYLNNFNEQLPQIVWSGIFSIYRRSIDNGALGLNFPVNCTDALVVCGTNEDNFHNSLYAHIPNCPNPLDPKKVPELLVVLDLIEFIYKNIAKPIQNGYHDFFKHYHFKFDKESGKTEFADEINTIFRRNNIQFILNNSGEVKRVFPETISAILDTTFNTGDHVLNELLYESTSKIKSPDIKERRNALEKLWDAWERIKTIEPGKDKKASAKAILDKAASTDCYRLLLKDEAEKLTDMGNNFRIRHSEINKKEFEKESQLDYFFLRAFCLIYILLKDSHRL
jgi:hypothetical protein